LDVGTGAPISTSAERGEGMRKRLDADFEVREARNLVAGVPDFSLGPKHALADIRGSGFPRSSCPKLAEVGNAGAEGMQKSRVIRS